MLNYQEKLLSQLLLSKKRGRVASSFFFSTRGSLLVVTLWMLFFLTLLGLAIAVAVRPQVTLAAKLVNRAKAGYIACAGVKRAMQEIEKSSLLSQGFDALNESWNNNEEAFKDVNVGRGSFNIESHIFDAEGIEAQGEPLIKYGLVDEERKININKVSRETLERFFLAACGFSVQQANAIVDSIMDWRDTDEGVRAYGAESDYYEAQGEGYLCKNGDFGFIEELFLVKGMTREIFDRVKSALTVYGSGAVNINTAGTLSLMSIGMEESLVKKIDFFRRGPDFLPCTEDDGIFKNKQLIAQDLSIAEVLSEDELNQISRALEAGEVDVRSENFSAESVGRLGLQMPQAWISFVVDKNKTIKYWHQN